MVGSRMNAFIFQRRPEALSGAEFGLTKRVRLDDDRLITRIIDAYRTPAVAKNAAGESQWSVFFDMNADIHNALLTGKHEYVASVLHDPGATNLFYGFDSLMAPYIDR